MMSLIGRTEGMKPGMVSLMDGIGRRLNRGLTLSEMQFILDNPEQAELVIVTALKNLQYKEICWAVDVGYNTKTELIREVKSCSSITLSSKVEDFMVAGSFEVSPSCRRILLRKVSSLELGVISEEASREQILLRQSRMNLKRCYQEVAFRLARALSTNDLGGEHLIIPFPNSDDAFRIFSNDEDSTIGVDMCDFTGDLRNCHWIYRVTL